MPIRLLIVTAAVLVQLMAGQAEGVYRSSSGDIQEFLVLERLVRTDAVGVEFPDAAERESFRTAIASLLSQDFQGAADMADPLDYDLIQYRDTPSGGFFYILEERHAQNAQGTYVFNPNSRRELSIQVPHPLVDRGTWAESVDMFLQTDAAFLQISGSFRCASEIESPCEGTTESCGTPERPYPISDAAHYTLGFYQVASDTVHEQAEPIVSISVHGYGCGTLEEEHTSSIAQISNGNTADVPNSLATQLARAMNDILFSNPINFAWRGAGSFNRMPTEPEALQAGGCVNFSGGTNVQGRSINGAPDPCADGFDDPVSTERFLHVEQQEPLRSEQPNVEGLSWQITIDALENLFEPVLWVDLEYAGIESGSWFRPYRTLSAAAAQASPGQNIYIKASQGVDPSLITARVFVESYGGSALIRGN